MDPNRKPPESIPSTAPPEPGPITSDTLFQGRAEVVIRHNGRDYRLRRTRLGKLILTA